jgi:multidrug efflux system membrane fusion protein
VKSDQVAIQNAQAVVQGDIAAIQNAQAGVSADSGSLNNAQVQSSYTKIFAPIDGQAGNILVTEGNVVQAGSTNALVTITQMQPIQVAFSVPESNLPEVQKHMNNGKLPVSVTFAGNPKPIQGSLSFVNNTVDTSTGTIQLIGDFDNSDGKLFPGQFVNTTLTLTEDPNATVVPAQAVQNGPNGQFVFVVNPDNNTVNQVPVVASSTINNLDVIQKGLQPGVQVVTDGQANLIDGSQVRVKTADQGNGNNAQSNSGQPNTGQNNSQPNTGQNNGQPNSNSASDSGANPGQRRRHRQGSQPQSQPGSQNTGGN